MAVSQKSTWAVFFARERAKLVNFVRNLLDDVADVESEDVVQDVFAAIFNKADISAPVGNLWAYTYRALRNRVIDIIRERRPLESLDTELPGETGLVLSDILSDLKFDTDNEAERKEIARDLTRAVDSLDKQSKMVFIATEIEHATFRELAERWNMPVGTLLAQKSRAMKKLRQFLLKTDSVYYSPFLKKG